MIVLDTSAVLGFMQNEPGSERVAAEILKGHARICVVNLSEVLSKLADWGMDWPTTRAAVEKLALHTDPFTQETALLAAQLRPLTRTAGLSLGDRACLAHARIHQSAVLTGDRQWLEIADAVGVEVISFRPSAHG